VVVWVEIATDLMEQLTQVVVEGVALIHPPALRTLHQVEKAVQVLSY
jgi:hypothetical protein